MATIDPDVNKLTRLANLDLLSDEQARLEDEFKKIVAFIDALRTADVSEVAATNQVTELENVYRADEVEASVHARTLLEVAPHRQGEYFRAPAVFGKES